MPSRGRRVRHARVGIPGVRDEHIVHPPRHEEQFLGFVQPQHDHRLERTQGAGLLHDGSHPEGHGDGADKDVQHISRLSVELLRAQSVEIDIPLAQFQPYLFEYPVDLRAQGVQVHRAEDCVRVDAQRLSRRGQVEVVRRQPTVQCGHIRLTSVQDLETQGFNQGQSGFSGRFIRRRIGRLDLRLRGLGEFARQSLTLGDQRAGLGHGGGHAFHVDADAVGQGKEFVGLGEDVPHARAKVLHLHRLPIHRRETELLVVFVVHGHDETQGDALAACPVTDNGREGDGGSQPVHQGGGGRVCLGLIPELGVALFADARQPLLEQSQDTEQVPLQQAGQLGAGQGVGWIIPLRGIRGESGQR